MEDGHNCGGVNKSFLWTRAEFSSLPCTSTSNKERLETVLVAIGQAATSPGTIYLVGGATALWRGWRETTVAIDMAMQPEPGGVFAAISRIKRDLDVAIELVDPNQFVPALPGWQGRSFYIGRYGAVDVYLLDFYSRALAKIERNHARDQRNVAAMLRTGVVTVDELLRLCAAVDEGRVVKFVSIDWSALMKKVRRTADDGR